MYVCYDQGFLQQIVKKYGTRNLSKIFRYTVYGKKKLEEIEEILLEIHKDLGSDYYTFKSESYPGLPQTPKMENFATVSNGYPL